MDAYSESMVKNATEFFAEGTLVFARCGEGIVCHIAECVSESDAKTAAEVLEGLRTK